MKQLRAVVFSLPFKASRSFQRLVVFSLGVAIIFGVTVPASSSSVVMAQAQPPTAGTGRWFYERALVLSIDQKQRVEAELRQAVQADPGLAEAHYFLGKLLFERGSYDSAITSLRSTVKLVPTHLPARLLLAAALHQKQFLKDTVAELEQALPLLGQKKFDLEVARLKSVLAGKEVEKNWQLLLGQTEDLLQWIDDSIKETPQLYQKFTTERGLRDAVVLLELAEMYGGDEDTSPELVTKFLRAIIELREGFFPVALIQVGAVLQPREPRAALTAYETGVAQLQTLGLRETVDYDLAPLVELRKSLGMVK